MAYTVVKQTKKGYFYLYAQRSVRVNGKVKTFNTYIGPVGSCSKAQIAAALGQQGGDGKKAKTEKNTGETVSVSPEAKSPKVGPGPEPAIPPSKVPGWVKGDTLKGDRLNRIYKEIGFDAKSVKMTYSRWGTRTKFVGRSLKGKYKIRLPFQKAFYKKADYRKVQHEAYAAAAMDHVKSKNPEKWAELKKELKPSWKTTNRLVARYILTSRDNERGVKAFIAWKTGMVIKTYKNRTTASQLGAGGERGTWERETKNVLVKLQMRGKKGAMKDFNQKYQRACKVRTKVENLYARTSRFRVVKRQQLRRAMKRSNLRVKAVREEKHKIETVSRVFGIS